MQDNGTNQIATVNNYNSVHCVILVFPILNENSGSWFEKLKKWIGMMCITIVMTSKQSMAYQTCWPNRILNWEGFSTPISWHPPEDCWVSMYKKKNCQPGHRIINTMTIGTLLLQGITTESWKSVRLSLCPLLYQTESRKGYFEFFPPTLSPFPRPSCHLMVLTFLPHCSTVLQHM